jgi:membrane protein
MRKYISEVFVNFQRDDLMILSAAFVYFALLSIVPITLLSVGITGWMLTHVPAAQELVNEQVILVEEVFGPDAGAVANAGVQGARANSLLNIVVGIAFVLFGASLVFNFLRTSNRRIFQGPLASLSAADAAKALMQQTGTDRAFGFIVVLGVVVFYVAAMVVLTVTNAALTWFGWQTEDQWLPWLAESGITLLLSALAMAGLFKFMPPVKVAWKHVWLPALVCAVALALLKVAFSLYVTYAAPTSTGGALGGVLALIIYLFSFGMIFFIATEMVKLNWRRDQRKSPATAVAAMLPPSAG